MDSYLRKGVSTDGFGQEKMLPLFGYSHPYSHPFYSKYPRYTWFLVPNY
jgi:hypothetical protein